ncbi:TPA: metal ABC transporter ATP-binding protein [Bacillus anthracis]|uniref:metal ABC transporter ATP-binding protein n=1 Tax=Bacillus anthracis TaxID=1392 RepID=UPI0003E4FEFD|nr:metal ABC transporter ATP-binding protein [Bacillus anthracis]KOR58712.1 zinc ABC transporter ATP-binding protein [Bacillus anthracis]WFN64742.1 metal ABC transporter ATP-binding protein [Bacillus anthracis]WFN70000.1 metal ABC transporter ATP-binding protein [Bacillus anthracis]WFN77300.1 metal ABC transporter ATP-binding protein [Bacillus anthracis]BBB74554.1 high-affinity zinc uptake system ATP-binding protein ZnuC [Bacillus anthracis]
MNNILEIEGLSFRYEDRNVLEDINLQVPKGAFLGLVGPNGSGKSTLLKCLLGVLKPKQGSIRLFGVDSKKFKEWNKVGYVSQKANSFNSGFPATVFEVVSMGLVSKKGLFRFFTKNDKEKVEKAIADVGMSEFQGRNIGELSGGQQQRVFIARALVSDPELLILDEPTVGIDVKNVESFYEILEDLNKRLGITLILVTHDMGAVTEKVTHVACLNRHLHFHGNVEKFRELEDAEMSVLYGHHVHRLEHEHEHHGRI